MIHTVLLNPALDVWYNLDELVPGSTRLDVLSQIHPAGKALNVAKVVRVLGEDVTVLGVMPENSLAQFRQYCDSLGIDSEFLAVEGSVRVNTTIIENEAGQVTHINSASPPLSLRIQDEMIALIQKHQKPGDFWAFCGSLPAGFDNDVYRRMIQDAHKKKCLTLLDTRGKSLKMGSRAKPDMIKPNLAELEMFFGEQVKGVHHIALKGKRLLDMGIPMVFISLGADGMIAIAENDCLLCSVPQVNVVDTVGCGDALVAGLIVGRMRHFSFSEMCRFAIACGASNAMHPGAGSVVLDDVWRLMEEIQIENA